jgi:hypothetical protein
MSIFPKRTLPGQSVTIHWNFNTSSLTSEHLFPLVRIGVKDPLGKLTMVFEDNLLVLPNPSIASTDDNAPKDPYATHLHKNVPLLVLADYLTGRHKREKLVEMLKGIHSARHYYFTFPIPPDAPAGKYTLLSEIYLDGIVNYSKTAEEDFFFVEKITLEAVATEEGGCVVSLLNHSSEPTPVKILEYVRTDGAMEARVRMLDFEPSQIHQVLVQAPNSFLLYNEEREVIPLQPTDSLRCLRNQQWISLPKSGPNGQVTFVMNPQSEEAYELSGATQEIWLQANGLISRDAIRNEGNASEYDQMLKSGLIREVSLTTSLIPALL